MIERGEVPLSRAVKRAGRRRTGRLISAQVRLLGVELDERGRAYLRQRLGRKLGKFATSIERVSVRVDDVNGPRGGVDQVCRINVVLIGLPPLVFERRDASLQAAIDGALTGAERAVRRRVQRRRMKPIRGWNNHRSGAGVPPAEE